MSVFSHKSYRTLFALIVAVLGLGLSASPTETATPYEPEKAHPLLDPWRWQVFTELNGKGLRCLEEDANGTIWFGVNDGLMSYDGLKWSEYTPAQGLAGNPTNCLLATRDGLVYAGSEMGISVFEDGAWRPVAISDQDLRWFVNDLAETSDGVLFAATSWGLLALSPEKTTLYTSYEKKAALQMLAPDVEVVAIPPDVVPLKPWSGSQLGCAGARIVEETWRTSRLELAPRIVWRIQSGGPAARAGLRVGDSLIGIDGQTDVGQERLVGPRGTRVRLTVRRPGEETPLEIEMGREQSPGRFGELSVHDICVDQSGSLWLGLVDGEIIRYERTNDTWKLYSTEDGLLIGGQPRIEQTRDGTVWAVHNARNSGINRFDGRTWQNLKHGTIGGDDDNSALLAISDGSLLVSGIVDMSRYIDGVWTTHRHELLAVPKTRVAQFIETSDGDVWVAALGGKAYRLDYSGRRWQTYENLCYQAETSDGVRWFLSDDDGVVSFDGNTWTRYGIEDGLIDASVRLIITRNDDVWVSGAHGGHAATARFDGSRWEKQVHPRLSETLDRRAAFEDRDGAVWFGAAPGAEFRANYVGGVVRLSGISTDYFAPPDVMPFVYGIGQTPDGSIWLGSLQGMVRYDGQTWHTVTDAPPFTTSFIDEVRTAANGDLWVGNRKYGVLRYDGKTWARYPMTGDLAQGRVKNILVTAAGNVLASTPEGLNGFDGRTWTPHVMHPDLPAVSQEGLRQARDGAVWLVSYARGGWDSRGQYRGEYPVGLRYDIKSIRYRPDMGRPDTKITASVAEVAQPGNTALSWEGADRWDATPRDRLQFAWRLDGGSWSAFEPATSRVLLMLAAGDHTFEVKARDLDFNEDPTPAVVHFNVIPPIWRQNWFLSLIVAGFAVVSWQGWRILRHRKDQLLANEELARANEELQNEMAERQRVEKELIRLERLRALGELSAGVSHNLNNILTSVLGPAQLIQRSTNDPELRADIDLVIASATRAADLVHRLHLSTRTGPPEELESVAVGRVVEEAVQTARPRWQDEPQSKGLHIDVVTDIGENYRVKGTATGLHEIIVNLLLNGVDAMPEGGVISVAARANEGQLKLTVADTGVGMDEETRRRVFEPFFTTKAEVGTGLGMSTAYAEVTRWEGTLQVESTPDVGTTFTMVLPLWEESTQEDASPISTSRSRRARLLVVDDDEMVRSLLARLLGRDHDVAEAANATEALKDLSSDRYDVALVDLGLPGMPGDQVAQRLREADPALVVILITGWELSEGDQRALAFDLQIEKPFRDLSEVERLVGEAIEMCDRRKAT